MRIPCRVDNSRFFLWRVLKRMSPATNFTWRFKGYDSKPSSLPHFLTLDSKKSIWMLSPQTSVISVMIWMLRSSDLTTVNPQVICVKMVYIFVLSRNTRYIWKSSKGCLNIKSLITTAADDIHMNRLLSISEKRYKNKLSATILLS